MNRSTKSTYPLVKDMSFCLDSFHDHNHNMYVEQEFCSLLAGSAVIAMMQGLGQDTVPAEL